MTRQSSEQGRHVMDRPRDEHGRFESESEHRGGSRQHERDYPYDRPRSEYGQFEAESRNRESQYRDRSYSSDRGRSQDRPRDEYGRFESESARSQWDDRYNNQDYERPRDEYGRFLPDFEDQRRSQSREYQGRMGGASRNWERPRDEFGRFESEPSYSAMNYEPDRGDRSQSDMGRARRYGNRSETSYTGSYGSQGRYFGHGPKNYKRSDERIREDVCEALFQDGDIDASEIEVKVTNGEVVLTGSVMDRNSKRRVEDVVESCSGVHDVRNEIRVQRESESKSKTASATGTRAEAKTA